MHKFNNNVRLIGNLDAKPEMHQTENGKKQAIFNVGITETYRDTSGKKVIETQWHRVVALGKLAEIAGMYFVQGREVAIEGRLINRTYCDNTGNTKTITEVHVHELLLLGVRAPEP